MATTEASNSTKPPMGPAERSGRRVATVIFLTIAVPFALSSTYQLGRGAYVDALTVLEPGPCKTHLTQLTSAVERAERAASSKSQEEVSRRFAADLQPEWDDLGVVEGACQGVPHGTDAYAAVVRLRTESEKTSGRRAEEIGGTRGIVKSLLGGGR